LQTSTSRLRPTRRTTIDVLLLCSALILSMMGAAILSPARVPTAQPGLPSGRRLSADTAVDARGHVVRVRPFRRIVSASTIGDQLLLELADPRQILATTAYSHRSPYIGHRLTPFRTVDGASVESLIALRPDLVLVNEFLDPRRVTRLRAAGLEVFDLGPMRGTATLGANIEQVGTLVGRAEAGQLYHRRFVQRLGQIAADVRQRHSALYVAYHGSRLSGGAAGTSYHDVLESAGLNDVVGDREGWPSYTPDELLALDPDWLVTSESTKAVICRLPGLSQSRACARRRVVAVADDLLSDPGFGMLEAAQLVRDEVYGPTMR
jgi:iron complex transport system substrate-binding protein